MQITRQVRPLHAPAIASESGEGGRGGPGELGHAPSAKLHLSNNNNDLRYKDAYIARQTREHKHRPCQ